MVPRTIRGAIWRTVGVSDRTEYFFWVRKAIDAVEQKVQVARDREKERRVEEVI